MIRQLLVAATITFSGAAAAHAGEIMWWYGVYGDEAGCDKFFGAPHAAGVFVDRAGAVGNEWSCGWTGITPSQGNGGSDQVFEVTAACSVEGVDTEHSGTVTLVDDGSALVFSIPEVYPETTFPRCPR